MVLLLVLALPARAQDDLATREAALRARVEASATDLAARCELGYVLVREERFEDARTLLAPTLDALPAPAVAERERRGTCLYNLGRAEEGLAHFEAAATRYRASLALRPNDAVQLRLDAVLARLSAPASPPPTAAPPFPRPARLAPELATRCALDSQYVEIAQELPVSIEGVTRAVLVDDDRQWRVAFLGETTCATSEVLFDEAWGWRWHDTSSVTATVSGSGERTRVAVRTRLTHDARLEARDFAEERVTVVWGSATELSSFTNPIAAHRGADPGFELALSFDAQGRSVLSVVSGSPPPEMAAMAGTHTLPMRDVPELWSGEVIPASLARAFRGRLFDRTRVVRRVDGDGLSAVVVFTETGGDADERGLFYAALRSGDRWMAARPFAQYYPATNASHRGLDAVDLVRVAIEPVLAGASPALVVEWQRERDDLCEDVMDEQYSQAATSVFWVEGTRARSWTIPTTVRASFGRSFQLSVALAAGTVTVAEVEGSAPPGVRGALGTHSIPDIHPTFSLRGSDEIDVEPPGP